MFSLKGYRAGRRPFNGREKKVTNIEFQNSKGKKTRLWYPQHFFFHKDSVFRFTYWQEEAGYLWDTLMACLFYMLGSALSRPRCSKQTYSGPWLWSIADWTLGSWHRSSLFLGWPTTCDLVAWLKNLVWAHETPRFGYLKLRNWTSESDWYGS